MKVNRPLCVFCWIAGMSLVAMLTLATLPADGAESEKMPAGLKVVSVETYPKSIEIKTRFDYRQLLLTARLATGETADVTRMAKLDKPSKIVEISPNGQVRAKADGSDQLTFTYGKHKFIVPVTVSGIGAPYEVSFVRDVQPIFAKTGCNSGTCHGAAKGKNGFKLSLRGYDDEFDYRAFTDDVASRRFNRAAPEQSLMLLKASGSIPHVGGVRTKVGDPYYILLRDWIANGVKFDRDSKQVTKIELHPKNPIIPRAGMKQQITVMATYNDGSTRDVTAEAFIESGNIEVIEADDSGVLTMLRRGEGPVLVRYEGAYAATTLTVMGDRAGFVWNNPPTNNYIDKLVYDKLQRVRVLSSPLCSDDEFVRRIYLDLVGLPPTADQVREFLNDKQDTKTKRDKLIDQLVGSREYVEHWSNKWADLLQVNRKFLGEEGSIALRNWIKHSVATNKPYDQFVREVLTSSGSTLENPPAAYYKVLREPGDAMENTTQLFLAVRFSCNKCHDHPFERWTQDQYYNLASYFAQVGRKEDPAFAGKKLGGTAVEGAKPLVEVVYDRNSGDVKHVRTGDTAPPVFPYSHSDLAPEGASRRQQLAHWITSKENQYFAMSYVNRLWGYMLGTGIIEPIDDIRAGNPPTNAELLDTMANEFVKSGFDAQHMLRTICKSRVYQQSIQTNKWNADDEINYSHAIPRRLPAEVLYDSIHMVTGSRLKIPGVPVGFRAAQLPDVGVKVQFLDDFGRPVRESACECERSSGMVLGPIMKLVNGPTVANAVGDTGNDLTKLTATVKDDKKLIEELFLRFLARYPTSQEVQLGIEAMQAAGQGHGELAAKLSAYEKGLPAKQTVWEKSLGSAGKVVWNVLEPTEMKSAVGAIFAKQDDKSIFVSGKNGKDIYTIKANTELKGVTGLKLEVLPDKRLTAGGPGRAKNGNLVLSELKLTAAPKSDPAKATAVALQNAKADFSQDSWTVAGAIDGNPATGWAIMPQFNKPHEAIFETKQPVGGNGGSILTFSLSHQYPDGQHTIGRFRISVTTSSRPFGKSTLPANIVAALATPVAKRTAGQKKTLSDYFRSLDGELIRLTADVARSAEQLKNRRLVGVQDLAWALINNPAFLFNR